MNLVGLDQGELMELAVSLGEKPFRGKQIYQQIYARKLLDVQQMTDLPVSLRERLGADYALEIPQVEQRRASSDGTVKFLFRLQDGQFIETVYIPEKRRDTLCISSQVGCGVGCTFCLTAQMGFRRNLTPGEIVGQVLHCMREGLVPASGFNIVFMGMGEPLYNYKNVMKAFRILTDQQGMDLSHRKITLSTSGVVPVLRKMNDEPQLPNLAISLNATTDQVRSRVMPINRKWPIAALLQACRAFPLEARRRITFEYLLLAGETDSDQDAHRLAQLLEGIPCKVNLIPYNPNPGLPHQRPSDGRVERFREILVGTHNLSAFVRRTRGDDISAACGQLAHMTENGNSGLTTDN
ncbi:MAG: 23S rRNA (adenine(2503)-C(2))-methyltransferase RlmN [Acidobacteriota bacterium]